MACQSFTPSLNPLYLPEQALYGQGNDLGWQLSKTPFALTVQQYESLLKLGQALFQFVLATEKLLRDSEKGIMPPWIAQLYWQGKPQELVRFAKMNALKRHVPLVIRPDLLLTETGWALCEIDSVPGGLGFTAALNQAYQQSGFEVLEAQGGLPKAFLNMLLGFWHTQKQAQTIKKPTIAIVLSDEAGDYLAEMTWLVGEIRQDYPEIHIIHPRQVTLAGQQLVFQTVMGEEQPIHLIYRFFELFDLPNIPQIELIQYAVKKGLVLCTPPFKPFHEEKLTLALFHHPLLNAFWQENLEPGAYDLLKKAIPHGWILDPTPLPPQSLIPDFAPKGQPVQSFEAGLSGLSQKQRELVIKPSGFSPLAWGSRGVTVGHDVSAAVWQERVTEALNAFSETPHILQTYQNTMVSEIELFTRSALSTDSANPENLHQVMKARTRLCPYFFVTYPIETARSGESDASGRMTSPELTLAGVLATSCPVDKKVIHGMKDAVLAPCQVMS
jgi:hypothetical protein